MTIEKYIENLTDLFLTKYPDTLENKKHLSIEQDKIIDFLLDHPRLYQRFLNNPEQIREEYPYWFTEDSLEKKIMKLKDNREDILKFFSWQIKYQIQKRFQIRREIDRHKYNILYYNLNEINHDIQPLIIQNNIKTLRDFKNKFQMIFESFWAYFISSLEDSKLDERYFLAHLEKSIRNRIYLSSQYDSENDKKEEKIAEAFYEFGQVLSEIAFQNGQHFERMGDAKVFHYQGSQEMNRDLIKLAIEFKQKNIDNENFIEEIDEFIQKNYLF